MTDLKRSQLRVREERNIDNLLSSAGSPDPANQGIGDGFQAINVFNATRYNFGTNSSYGTFSVGSPSAIFPIQFNMSAYNSVTEQFVMGSDDFLNFVRIEFGGAVTLSLLGQVHQWSPISIYDGRDITIRFEHVSGTQDVRLRYQEVGGNFIDHPDGDKTFTLAQGQIDTISTNATRPAYAFDGGDRVRFTTRYNMGAGDAYSFRSRNAALSTTAQRSIFGTANINTNDNQTFMNFFDNNDGTHELLVGWRGTGNKVRITFPAIDWTDEHFITISRTSGTLWELFIDGVLVGSDTISNNTQHARFDTVGRTYEPNTDEGWRGEVFDVSIGYNQGANIDFYPMNEGTDTVVCSNNPSRTGEILGYDVNNWLAVPFLGLDGTLNQLTLGDEFWAMDEFGTSTLEERNLPRGNNIEIQNYDVGSWEAGNSSLVNHTEDDDGLGSAFQMIDNSPTLFPAIQAAFSQEENDNFASHGGLISQIYRYPDFATIADGSTLGGVQMSWDRRWDGDIRQYLQWGGAGYIAMDDSYAFTGETTASFEIRDYDPANSTTQTIFGSPSASNCHVSLETIGGTGQLIIQNTNGDFCLGDGTEFITNGNFDTDITDWATSSGNYTLSWDAAKQSMEIEARARYPAIENVGQFNFQAVAGTTYIIQGVVESTAAGAPYWKVRRTSDGSNVAVNAFANLPAGTSRNNIWRWTATVTEDVFIQFQTNYSASQTYPTTIWYDSCSAQALDDKTIGLDLVAGNYKFDITTNDDGSDSQCVVTNLDDGTEFFNGTGSPTIGTYNNLSRIAVNNIGGANTYFTGTISDILVSNNGNPILDLPINEGTGATRVENAVGNGGTINGGTWVYLDPIYQAIVATTVKNGTGIDLVLHSDDGNKTYNVPVYDDTKYSSFTAGYNPDLQTLDVYIDEVLVPDLSGGGFRFTSDQIDGAWLRTWTGTAGDANGINKSIKQFRTQSFLDDPIFDISKVDFDQNTIFRTTGIRDITLQLPSHDGTNWIRLGSKVYFECPLPTDVTVQRQVTDVQSLLNDQGEAVTIEDIRRLTLVSGNDPRAIPSAPDPLYSAYFTSNLSAFNTVVPTGVRYIRLSTSGVNSVNNGLHIIEMEAIDETGANVASGVIGTTPNGNFQPVDTDGKATDGDKAAVSWWSPSTDGEYTVADWDLGSAYELDEINLWLYFPDGRTYYDKTIEVSDNGVIWRSVYDATETGDVAEPSDGSGHTYPVVV